MSVPAIEIRNLWFAFRESPVLDDVNLTLPAGEFLGIIGPNGAGKSVLMRLLLGLLTPDRGEVRIFGAPPAVRGLDNDWRMHRLPFRQKSIWSRERGSQFGMGIERS